MHIRVSETSGAAHVSPQEQAALDSFMDRASDPTTALEVLLTRNGRLQRQFARGRMERQRAMRQKELERALAKTRQANHWRLGQRIFSVTLDLIAKGLQAAGCQNMLIEGIKAVDGAVEPMGTVAETFQLDAEAARIRSGVHGDEAADAAQWLAKVRETEQRMLGRLENMERARHESVLRSASFGR